MTQVAHGIRGSDCTTGTCRICIEATQGRGGVSVPGGRSRADGYCSGAANASSEGLGSLRALQPPPKRSPMLNNTRQKTLIQTRVLHS